MGSVYSGYHLRLQLGVAVKVMRPDLAFQPGSWAKRFRREAALAARVSHQNLVRAYDVMTWEGRSYIVMELILGESCRELVTRRGPLSVRQALGIATQAAAGMATAHAEGIVHRDLKPDNILLSSRGVAKVADLGLAKALGDSLPDATLQTTTMGTPQYMAPEQWRDTSRAGPEADVFSLGATLYFLLAGDDARPRGGLADLMQLALSTELPDLRAVRQDVSAEVAEIVQRATALAPESRFASAFELHESLAALEGGDIGLGVVASTEKLSPGPSPEAREAALSVIRQWSLPKADSRAPEVAVDDAGSDVAERPAWQQSLDSPGEERSPAGVQRLWPAFATVVLVMALIAAAFADWLRAEYARWVLGPFDATAFVQAMEQHEFDLARDWLWTLAPESQEDIEHLADLREHLGLVEALVLSLEQWNARPREGEIPSRKREIRAITQAARDLDGPLTTALAEGIGAAIAEMDGWESWVRAVSAAPTADEQQRDLILRRQIDVDWRGLSFEHALADLSRIVGLEVEVQWHRNEANVRGVERRSVTLVGSVLVEDALTLLGGGMPVVRYRDGKLLVGGGLASGSPVAVPAALFDISMLGRRPLDEPRYIRAGMQPEPPQPMPGHDPSESTIFSSELSPVTLVDPEEVLNIVRENIAAAEWDFSDMANIDFSDDGSLIVYHTPVVHRQVEDLLRRLLLPEPLSEREQAIEDYRQVRLALDRLDEVDPSALWSPLEVARETGLPLVVQESCEVARIEALLSARCISNRTDLSEPVLLGDGGFFWLRAAEGMIFILCEEADRGPPYSLSLAVYELPARLLHPGHSLEAQYGFHRSLEGVVMDGRRITWRQGPPESPAEAMPAPSEDTLLTLIQDNIYPDLWTDNPEYSITQMPGRLIIRATAAIHQEIQTLLDSLASFER